MDEDSKILEKRKKRMNDFVKNPKVWVIGFLIIAVVLGVYIRSIPMHINPSTNHPYLWDVTTNTWTLGPDLDPWLFLRTAKTIVETGSIPHIDTMRNVPLGFDNTKETELLPYMIAGTYWFFKAMPFIDAPNVEFAGVIFPVIMFGLTIIAFFLFVREIFMRKSMETKANLIALISTFFMIVIPVFLPRTIAGIPEKESAGFFFMFLTFYLFLKAWKYDKPKKYILFGILAGISTAVMGMIWGGVLYVFITIATANLFAFIINKIHKKEFIIYTSWIVSSFVLLMLSSSVKFPLEEMLTSLSSGLAFAIFIIFCVHFILWDTKLANYKILKKTKLPENIISIIVAVVVTLILSVTVFGPDFIWEKLKVVHQTIFRPVVGRWNVTVAENKQPFFIDWVQDFGPFIKSIPVLFSMFFIGSIVLFRNMLKKIKKKEAWILTIFFALFLTSIIFSRYAPHPALFDGEGFISKFVYYCSALLFIAGLIYYYLEYHKKQDKSFENIFFGYIFLFVLFILCLFTARGAVRLIMVLGTIAPIFAGYLLVDSAYSFKNSKDETKRFFLGIIFIVILLSSIFAFISFYHSIKVQASYEVPGTYNQQWQKAMSWVRDDTPTDSVFAHWWDYGYWVQSIGDRATVLDGGNAIVYWNYLMGRYVLTGDNQKDALDFLYDHNATHLLIDSSDVGKYGAFSSIGSDENYDRFSWIPVMVADSKQTQETKDGIVKFYPAGIDLDEDINYEENGQSIFLPSEQAGLAGILLRIIQDGTSIQIQQPTAIFIYNGQQYQLPMRYLYYQGKFVDFKTGIEGTADIIQKIDQTNQQLSIDNTGAIIYISPRVMKGMFAQKYLLDDPFGKFPNFEIEHIEQSPLVNSLNAQGSNLIGEFVYYQGLQGPIKIWKINYSGNEQIRQEFIDTDASKYLSWKL
jgi:asparagine N-glycosylation enzyme membrane subunit Stt3